MELYPINNAIEAHTIVEQSLENEENLRTFDKIGDSGNQYRIAVSREGFFPNSTKRFDDIVVRLQSSYGYEFMDSVVYQFELYGIK